MLFILSWKYFKVGIFDLNDNIPLEMIIFRTHQIVFFFTAAFMVVVTDFINHSQLTCHRGVGNEYRVLPLPEVLKARF